MSATLECLRVIFLLLAPQVLRHLLSVLQHPNESKWDGVEYCVLLVAVGLLGAICETHTYFQLNNAGIKMKTALISALYRKSLKLLQPSGMYGGVGVYWVWESIGCGSLLGVGLNGVWDYYQGGPRSQKRQKSRVLASSQ